ncbi:hypothetical protein CS542_10445 [Pedobacter sp. IW39]|nr:hypothetical protein CS542_10445 [Pedobacter sp. IW39]
MRNKAILEVYGCGLSNELITLRISDLNPTQEYIKVTGKNMKGLSLLRQCAEVYIDIYLTG